MGGFEGYRPSSPRRTRYLGAKRGVKRVVASCSLIPCLLGDPFSCFHALGALSIFELLG